METERYILKRTPPKPPTMEEMQVRLPGLKLYSPAQEWIPMEVHALTIYATPDKGGAIEPHPVDGEPIACDGLTEIKGRYFRQKDSSGKQIEGQDAYSRMTYLIHKERFGEMGMCWIPGTNPEEDEQLKVFAREQYLKYQSELDDRVLERRKEFVANWRKNPAKKGESAPPPSLREKGAIDRSMEREKIRTYEFNCDVDTCAVGYATNDWAEFAGHMQVAHDIKATRTDNGYTLKTVEGTLRVSAASGLSSKTRRLSEDELQREEIAEADEVEKETAIEAAAIRAGAARGAPRRRAR